MPSAESVWWKRVRAAADRKGNEGSRLMSDWSREWVGAIGDLHPRCTDFPCTDPNVLAEQRRLTDQLRRALGVGRPP